MEKSPSWEDNKYSASYGVPHIHNSLPPVPILRHIIPFHATHIILLSTPLVPTKTLYASLLSPTCATFPDKLILIDFITRIFGEQYRSYSSKLCSLLLSHVILSPFYTHGLIINLPQHYYNPWRFLKNIQCWFHYLILLLYKVAMCYKTHKRILFIMHPSDLHHSLLDNSIRQVTLVFQKEWVHQIHFIQTQTGHSSWYCLL